VFIEPDKEEVNWWPFIPIKLYMAKIQHKE
jgi:hypothetical protein